MDANMPVSGAVLTGSSCLLLQPNEVKESRNEADAIVAGQSCGVQTTNE
jgi:hypothetical protein